MMEAAVIRNVPLCPHSHGLKFTEQFLIKIKYKVIKVAGINSQEGVERRFQVFLNKCHFTVYFSIETTIYIYSAATWKPTLYRHLAPC